MPRAASWAGSPSIKGSSEPVRMALLTFCLIGLQFTWGIEMTYCTPYLLQLGLTKSRTSLVWIAGPLSGLIMQPVVGVLADNSKSKWGRRRPFMIGGSLIVSLSLLVLGWTAEIVALFVSNADTAKSCTIALAILSIYAVDFAINAVQASCRSLIVDTLPTSKQQLGSAWASRMIAIGSLVGYAIGTIDLVKVFGPTFGDTQFKQLTFVAALFFVISVGITCWAVGERILISAREEDTRSSALNLLSDILKTTFNLPVRIKAICWVQFWAWIGWFPFLFYSATWVGEVYFRYHPETNAKESADALGDVGRVGSLSLVVFSVVTLIGSVALPWFIQAPESALAERRSFTPRPSTSRLGSLLTPIAQIVNTHKPDLLTAWQYSHIIFAGAMILAPLVKSIQMATVLVSICGIPWALTCWAPFAFMGIEINRLTSTSSSNLPLTNGHLRSLSNPLSTLANGTLPPASPSSSSPSYPTASAQNPDDATMQLHLNHNHSDDSFSDNSDADSTTDLNNQHSKRNNTTTTSSKRRPLRAPHHRSTSDFSLLHDNSTGETAGIYLGILNLFTTLPQFVGTFIATCVFALLEPGKSPELHDDTTHQDIRDAADKPNAIAVCLAIGALSAMAAAVATSRMRKGSGKAWAPE